MSRFTLVASLVFGLSSASIAHAQFAKAPPPVSAKAVAVSHSSAADVWGTDLRVAPARVLDKAQVRAALVKARATNLAAFRAYQAKGVFPNNTFKGRKLNVWLDNEGNFCAAATIIKMSGQDDLVAKVADTNNFIRLGSVEQGPVMDWILTSGFTQDEIAAIQEPFMPVSDEPSMLEPTLVDNDLRKAEDARLAAKYKTVDKQIVKQAKQSLDSATDRLMKNPTLAWKLVNANS